MTDLPGAPDDDGLESSTDRLEHEVAADDTLGASAAGRGPGDDGAISAAEGAALAPPD
jgi:hypothetical protein